MGFKLPALCPDVRLVVVVHVAQQERIRCPVHDDPEVGVGPDGPEVFVAGPVELVKLHPGVGGIQLKVTSRRLGGLLLVAGKARYAMGKGVTD